LNAWFQSWTGSVDPFGMLNKVVVHFADGRILKGRTRDFLPKKADFHVESIEHETSLVHVAELKAIFFVRDHTGTKDRVRTSEDEVAGGGRKIRVVFGDGEELIGFTSSYQADRPGFFMVPADLKGNNERVFVATASAKLVEFV